MFGLFRKIAMISSRKGRRRLVDHISKNPSYVASGVTLTGSLSCEGDLMVAGSIKGEIRVRGAITLLEGSRSEGNVTSTSAVVGGEVEGNVIAAERLEIRKSARVHGSVHARTIAVAEGAMINGEVGMSDDASVIRFQEKRKQDKE